MDKIYYCRVQVDQLGYSTGVTGSQGKGKYMGRRPIFEWISRAGQGGQFQAKDRAAAKAKLRKMFPQATISQ